MGNNTEERGETGGTGTSNATRGAPTTPQSTHALTEVEAEVWVWSIIELEARELES